MKNQEHVECSLGSILFQNDEHFIIGNFFNKETRAYFKAKGDIINPQVGLSYRLTGKWEVNQKYGNQFAFTNSITVEPVTLDEIYTYIVKKCKGVGPSTGKELIDKYGLETLETIRKYPEKIAEDIPGFTITKAREIQKQLLTDVEYELAIVKLEGMLTVPGLRKNTAKLLIKKYEGKAPDALRENPYILTNIHGIGFEMADRVAAKMGFPRDSIFRKEAATIHALKQNQCQGSVWISKKDLIEQVKILIQIVGLEAGVDSLIEKGDIVEWNGYYAIEEIASHEKRIAEKMINLNH